MADDEDLIEAAKANDLARVAAIVRTHPEFLTWKNPAGTNALSAAIAAGNAGIVDYLLRKEVKLDVFAASRLGRGTEVQSMLASNHDLAWRYSDDGFTALHLAAEHGHPEVVAHLIRGISEINAKAREGAKATALHFAALNGHERVAEQLIAAGADVNFKDANNKTPLGVALEAGQTGMVALLQRYGGVEKVVAAAPRAAVAVAAPAGGAPAEAVDPATGKPTRATERAIDAINKSREKRGLPPLPKPTATAGPAAAGAPAGAEGTDPLTGKPTAATDRAREAINKSRAKRGLPPLEGPGGATAAAPSAGASAANTPTPDAGAAINPATGKPSAGADRAAAAIARARAKREAAARGEPPPAE